MMLRSLIPGLVVIACIGLAGCGSSAPVPDAGNSNSTFENAITVNVAKLEDAVKTKYMEALADEAFADQEKLITGTFHGVFKDEDFESFYQYDRKPDGTITHTTVDMYHADKEYLRETATFPWKSEGRVIFERDATDHDLVYILLLKEVTQEKIKYQLIDPEAGMLDDMESVDLRGPGTLPEMPEGWTEIEP